MKLKLVPGWNEFLLQFLGKKKHNHILTDVSFQVNFKNIYFAAYGYSGN